MHLRICISNYTYLPPCLPVPLTVAHLKNDVGNTGLAEGSGDVDAEEGHPAGQESAHDDAHCGRRLGLRHVARCRYFGRPRGVALERTEGDRSHQGLRGRGEKKRGEGGQ